MARIDQLTFAEFIEEYWPCQYGGTWYEGSELVWDGEGWCLERVTYEALSVVETGILLGERDPYELWDALKSLTPESTDEEATEAITGCTPLHVQCCYVDDPRSSSYWAEFDGYDDYYDDGPEDDDYVYHRGNGVMTNKAALDEWAEVLREKSRSS